MKAKGLKQTWSKKELLATIESAGNSPVYVNVVTDPKAEIGFIMPIKAVAVSDPSGFRENDLIQINCELDMTDLRKWLFEVARWHAEDGRFTTFPKERLNTMLMIYGRQ